MMKNMMKTACAIAVLAASANVMAESVDLSIKGNITPVACTPEIAGGGVIDYGTIAGDSLKADDFTYLPARTTNLTIHCDAPAKIALKVTNNRTGTVPGRPIKNAYDKPTDGAKLFGTENAPTLGLGMANENAIGGWAATFTNPLADDVKADVILTSNTGTNWIKNSWLSPTLNGTRLSSMAKTGELVPVAARIFSYDIKVESYINKSSELDLSKPAALDGSATIELVYL